MSGQGICMQRQKEDCWRSVIARTVHKPWAALYSVSRSAQLARSASDVKSYSSDPTHCISNSILPSSYRWPTMASTSYSPSSCSEHYPLALRTYHALWIEKEGMLRRGHACCTGRELRSCANASRTVIQVLHIWGTMKTQHSSRRIVWRTSGVHCSSTSTNMHGMVQDWQRMDTMDLPPQDHSPHHPALPLDHPASSITCQQTKDTQEQTMLSESKKRCKA